ncbi:chloride channel protein, partial [Gaiella sp.]|uniref:chloride channel protein n=1 Tax=Gaiella sp. TaxID=2663207 RepID=UPI002E313CB9
MRDAQAKAYVRTLVLAAALGVPVAFAAVLYETVLHDTIHLVWDEIPDAFGWSTPAWWYVILVPAVGGLLVSAVVRLPGHGGHGPLEGIGVEPIRPVDLWGILLAALASLGLGLVLGPEAPLIALGLGLGALAVRVVGADEANGRLLVLAGSFAAISTLFGGPLVAAFLLLELTAVSGKVPAHLLGRALLPGFVAAGTGALVFTGVAGWPGLHQSSLTLPSIPAYGTVRLADLVGGVLLAVVVAAVVVVFRHLAHGVAAQTILRPVPLLVTSGLLVGLLAVVFRAIADRPVDLVLFSGQSELPAVVAESSTGV